MKPLTTWVKHHYQIATLGLLLILAMLTHSLNMFRFPAYFDDEGTYMSQAWSVIKLQKLAPYTYWYDHAPLGWLLISAWVALTGGFFTFGVSVNSGRVLMLFVHLLNTLLLYKLGRKLSSFGVAVVAVLIYIFSPLAITLHRMVFLDNLMLTFLLFSVLLIVKQKNLYQYFLSGLFFGLATLIKEVTPFFLLPVLYLLIARSPKTIKRFAVFGWLAAFGITVFLYPTFALLKGEFFPSGTPLGGQSPHVSLIETLKWQATRKGGFFLSPESEFLYTLKNSWLPTDRFLIIGGVATTLFNLILGIFFKRQRLAALTTSLLSLGYILYLIRGGIVNDQYLIPVLPFLALNLALLARTMVSLIPKNLPQPLKYIPYSALVLVAAYFYKDNPGIYTLDQTGNQVEALQWVKHNIPHNEVVAVDAYGLVDFFEMKTQDLYQYKGPQHYWKLDPDPQIYANVLDEDWRNIDYILATPKLRHDIQYKGLPSLKKAYKYSQVVQAFENNNPQLSSYYGKPFFGNILIADGNQTEIRKRIDEQKIALYESWEGYKKHFIHSYGQVIDPQSNLTTSEGQSYALLRSVWVDDQEMFDNVWQWTKDHLQHRQEDKLLSWKWGQEDGQWQLLDSNAATDADQDIALALILAYRRWQKPSYLEEARQLVDSIFQQEIVKLNGRYVVTSGNNAKHDSAYLVNPSYLSPAHYRTFATIDPDHPWEQIADDSYRFLDQLQDQYRLPPNWVVVTLGGAIRPATTIIGESASDFSYDAFRIFWRVALDASWYGSPQAKQYLQSYQETLNQLTQSGGLKAIYTTSGEAKVDYSDAAISTSPLAVQAITQPDQAKAAADVFGKEFNQQTQLFTDKQNYYQENWIWLTLALVNDFSKPYR